MMTMTRTTSLQQAKVLAKPVPSIRVLQHCLLAGVGPTVEGWSIPPAPFLTEGVFSFPETSLQHAAVF